MKKLMLTSALLLQTTLFAVDTAPAPEYEFIKFTYNNTYAEQSLITFFAEAINQVRDVIERECGNVEANTDCTIETPVTITANQTMADASEVFFGPDEGMEVNETLPLPSQTLVFRKLENSKFQYAVTIDTSKIDDEMHDILTFSWNADGDVLRVLYTNTVERYDGSFIQLERDGVKKMISNGYFNTVDEEGERNAGAYVMEVRLLNEANNQIAEVMSFKDTSDPEDPIDVTSKGIVDNDGGTVYIKPFNPAGITFDKNGLKVDDGTLIDVTDSNNGATLAGSDTHTNGRYVVVPKGEEVTPYNVVGYVFKNYDDNGYEYEYFGTDTLLAEANATSDTDQLDIYLLDEMNKANTKVEGLWFTK